MTSVVTPPVSTRPGSGLPSKKSHTRRNIVIVLVAVVVVLAAVLTIAMAGGSAHKTLTTTAPVIVPPNQTAPSNSDASPSAVPMQSINDSPENVVNAYESRVQSLVRSGDPAWEKYIYAQIDPSNEVVAFVANGHTNPAARYVASNVFVVSHEDGTSTMAVLFSNSIDGATPTQIEATFIFENGYWLLDKSR